MAFSETHPLSPHLMKPTSIPLVCIIFPTSHVTHLCPPRLHHSPHISCNPSPSPSSSPSSKLKHLNIVFAFSSPSPTARTSLLLLSLNLTQLSLPWIVSSVLSCTAYHLAALVGLPDSPLTLHYLLLALWPKNTSYSGGLPLPTAILLPPPLSSAVLSLSKVLFSMLADPSRWRHHEILSIKQTQFVYVSMWGRYPWAQVPVRGRRGAGAPGSLELPKVGPKSQTQVLCSSSSHS